MTSTETDHERHVRQLLAELAETTPVRPKRLADLEGAAPLPLVDASRPSRLPWLAAAAAVVIAFALGVSLLTAREDADPFAVDAFDVPVVDTAALADGRLAFVMENDLFLADGATGEVRRITDIGVGEEVSHVSWSHDGEWLAFTIHDESGLWVVNRDGSERHRIGRAPSSYAWSPVANKLAYVTADEVRVARVDGSSYKLKGGSPPEPHTRVAWSPDGESIAFARAGDELAIAPVVSDPEVDIVWNMPFSPSVGEVLAWPTDDVVLFAEPQRADELVQISAYHPSNGGVQGLAEFQGPWDPTNALAVSADGMAFVVAPMSPITRASPFGCTIDVDTANCGTDLGLPPGADQPALTGPAEPGIALGLAVVAENEIILRRWWPGGGFGTSSNDSLGIIDDGTRGTIEVDGGSYGVVPEPPVWIGNEALVVRVNERDLVRIDAETGERTTIVAGPRFLPPADDYPGGFGFAFWRPTP